MTSFLPALTSYLPKHEGLLPKWLLLVSAISALNSIQAYSTLAFTQRVYAGPSTSTPKTPSSTTSPVTPLSSRTFGTWTILAAVVRAYAAYNITNKAFYQLAYATYIVAFGHFASEWLVYKTARWGEGLVGPIVVASGSLVWMAWVWGDYVV